MKQAAVLIRLDKIGDLINTIPVDELEALKSFDVHWVISKGLGFIPESAVPKRNYIELEAKKSWSSFWELRKFLKEKKTELAISFQAPWWVSLALWLEKIPKRAGSLSQWHSWLFLNAGLRQKRSQALKHEAEYNADLVFHVLGQTVGPAPRLKLQASASIHLSNWGLQTKEYIVVHPGMAGSALNWKEDFYIDFIEKMKNQNQIVITGTASDEVWLVKIKARFLNDPKVTILQNKLSAPELLTVLANAKSVLAPSTGVLHIAASLGVSCIGLYSPVQVQSPMRWQARGPNVTILTPEVTCPARFKCLGTACDKYYCMDRILVSKVISKVEGVSSV